MFQYSIQPISNSSRGQTRHGRERKNAIHTVLTSPKLLSHILSLLPIKDLLISAQRVNRTWNNVIENTTSLQAALFLTSSSPTTPRILNPLLKTNWPQWFQAPSSFNKKRPRATASDFYLLKWAQRPSAFRRREASWRRMLVVSGGPEITGLKVTLRTQSWLGWQESHGMVLCSDGLRMGLLYDLTKDWCTIDGDATFMMNWAEDLTTAGSGRVAAIAPIVENRWKHKLRKIFPKKQTRSGFTDLSLKSSTSSFAKVDAYSTDGSQEGTEDQFLEIILTYSISSQPLEDDPPPALGPELQSDAYEKVNIVYGESSSIPGP